MSDLDNDYKRLSRRREIYKGKTKVWNRITILGFCILIATFISGFRDLSQSLPFSVDFLNYLLIIGFIVFLIGLTMSARRGRLFLLSEEQKLFLQVYSSLQDVKSYLTGDSELSRIEAADTLKKVLKSVELWRVESSLELIRKVIGGQIAILQENIKDRLLPTVFRGDRKDLEKVITILEDFARYLRDPSISKLETLNISMSSLSTEGYKEASFRSSVEAIFMKHSLIQHLIVTASCIGVGGVAYWIGTVLLHISPDNSYTASIAIFGILFAAYLNSLRKK